MPGNDDDDTTTGARLKQEVQEIAASPCKVWHAFAALVVGFILGVIL